MCRRINYNYLYGLLFLSSENPKLKLSLPYLLILQSPSYHRFTQFKLNIKFKLKKMKNICFLFSILVSVLLTILKSDKTETEKTPLDFNLLNDTIQKHNMSSIATLCDEGDTNE